jgi:hypothetical protein
MGTEIRAPEMKKAGFRSMVETLAANSNAFVMLMCFQDLQNWPPLSQPSAENMVPS